MNETVSFYSAKVTFVMHNSNNYFCKLICQRYKVAVLYQYRGNSKSIMLTVANMKIAFS